MPFPATRLRRLRRTAALRSLTRETHLHPGALIYPLFLCPGEGVRKEVSSMPGVFNLSIDEAVKEAEACASLGIGGLLLFGLPAEKDEHASGAYDSNGIVQQGLRAIKSNRRLDSLVAIADVCLCEYTSHGHCGIVSQNPDSPHFTVENDATLALLAKTAVSLAQAGADIVAPSDMMDGRVAAIRAALDAAARTPTEAGAPRLLRDVGIEPRTPGAEQRTTDNEQRTVPSPLAPASNLEPRPANLADTPILSYAAKFSSAFYGPFREAADSAPQFGDRRSYQMDGANLREAMREIDLDVAEGADMLLMKPAGPYLDVIRAARDRFDLPLGAYQVSGEYSMLHAAFARGWLSPEAAIMESLLSIRRAGADFIVTYFAKDAAKVLG
ncbi:MAG TPA: porphobilinogen synthase [Acidobacteriaceae bacterium]|nr:porphobilinogen synthase [Acidobacteriaceae bacterium]